MMPDLTQPWALAGARLYTESGVLSGGSLWISEATISELRPGRSDAKNILALPPDWHVVPGFIDSHIHGADGVDVMDATAKALAQLSRYLPREGTTAFLATTMTASDARMRAAMTALGDFAAPPGGAEMLGVHLEGPFINAGKMGAQSAAWIVPPSIALFEQWHALCQNRIKVATLAPELAGAAALMRALRKHGVRPSIGHSNCSAAIAEQALAGDCHRATHLFNAMSGLHHRDPGAACAILSAPDCVAEIIADDIHVAPAMLRLAYRMKTSRGLIAITDSMRAKGLADGVYDLGGQRVSVCQGAARLEDGTLAGSVLRLDQGLRNIIRACDCSLGEAIEMLSTNPAADLDVLDRKGTLAPGKDADCVVLDEHLTVRMTVCRGQPGYHNL